MKKIVMLPLDERPCNYLYPSMMGKANYFLALPSITLLGKKKQGANVDKLAAWLIKNCKDADALIVSIDMLAYGGIVPSRLHNDTIDEIKERINILKVIKQKYPKLVINAFQLIMRCPAYDSDDEEPDYYQTQGLNIFNYGRLLNKSKENILDEFEKQEFAELKHNINQEALKDFTKRRKTNLQAVMYSLSLLKENVFDYFIIPQDDSSEYGFTTMDQKKVRKYISKNKLKYNCAMYPSADDTGLTMLARTVSILNNSQLKIKVIYACKEGRKVIPCYEDRSIYKTVKEQIRSANAIQVKDNSAEIILAINIASKMTEQYDDSFYKSYYIDRNLDLFIQKMNRYIHQGKYVAVADVAYPNSADKYFIDKLNSKNLLLKVTSYAGWNTSSNTLGTTICQTILYAIGKDDEANIKFMLHRYYEDVGYMGYVRSEVTNNILPTLGYNYFDVGDGLKVAKVVRKELINYMKKNYPSLAKKVLDVDVEMPWNRMFEVSIDVKLREGENYEQTIK